MLDRLFHKPAYHVEVALVEGLLEVPEGPGAQGLHRVLWAAIARDHDARKIGFQVLQLAHQLDAVDAGHAHVAQDEVDGLRGDEGQSLARVSGQRDREPHAREHAVQGPAVEFLIIDDENVRFSQLRNLRAAEGGPRSVETSLRGSSRGSSHSRVPIPGPIRRPWTPSWLAPGCPRQMREIPAPTPPPRGPMSCGARSCWSTMSPSCCAPCAASFGAMAIAWPWPRTQGPQRRRFSIPSSRWSCSTW